MEFKSIQDFRNRATKADLIELESFINNQQKKAEAFPNDKYNFSYTSASSYLREKGYLGGKTKENTDEFIIKGLKKTEFTSRTFTIQKDILERINQLADDNWQYSKKAIINKLLDDALKKYGY